ncbi:MAG: amino acid permease [Firmicutes bacterium]|nr:amino acid permease [Bacillota bacterium]
MDSGKLKKELGVSTATTIVVGSVIGAGVFFKPYAIYNATGGAPGMGFIAWILGGLMSILGALTFAEIAVLIPKTGGMVAYLSDVYDKRLGFLAGWMQMIIFYPAFLAGYGVKVGSELSEYLGAKWATPIGILVIICVCALNIIGTKTASKVQVVSTVCKLLPLFLIMIVGLIMGSSTEPLFTPMVGAGVSSGSALGATLLAVLFAFEGWTNVGAIAGEMKNPGKDLPLAIVGGVSIIMAVYLLINVAYIKVIPANELMNIESPAAAVAVKLFGNAGGTIIRVGIIISVIGAANGFLMSGSRVAYSLAANGDLPCSEKLAQVNEGGAPANAIILVGFLACIYSLSGKFDLLTDVAVFSCWIFYSMTFATVIKMRKDHPEMERKYKVPLYPIVPIVAIVSGLYVCLSFAMSSTGLAIASIIVTLTGLPVYMAVNKKKA